MDSSPFRFSSATPCAFTQVGTGCISCDQLLQGIKSRRTAYMYIRKAGRGLKSHPNHILAEMKIRGVPQCLRQIQAERHCLPWAIVCQERGDLYSIPKANTSANAVRACEYIFSRAAFMYVWNSHLLSKIQIRDVHPSYLWHHITTPGVPPRGATPGYLTGSTVPQSLSSRSHKRQSKDFISATTLIRAKEAHILTQPVGRQDASPRRPPSFARARANKLVPPCYPSPGLQNQTIHLDPPSLDRGRRPRRHPSTPIPNR